MCRLKGRVVVLAGAAGPKGQAIASKLLQAGAQLAWVQPPDRPEAVHSGEVYATDHLLKIEADAQGTDAVREILQQVLDRFGRVDGLIFAQDEAERCTAADCTDAVYHRIMGRNAKAAFFYTQVFGGAMVQAGSGKILYIGSIHDEKPTGSSFVYSLSKGALKMLKSEAALQLGRRGVDVHLIAAGPMEGDEARFLSGLSGIYEDAPSKIPSRALCSEAELAELCAYLLIGSTRSLNGTDIRMDGGFTLYYMDKE